MDGDAGETAASWKMWEIARMKEGLPALFVMRLSNAMRTLISSNGYVNATDVIP